MSIIRARKSKEFTVINNTCFKNPAISARAKGLYAYLMTLPDDWKLYKSELPNHFAEGRVAIDTAFRELEDFGYITKRPLQKSNGQMDGWDYEIFETPHLQETDLQETDLPENCNTVNLQLLNTDLNKELKNKEKDINIQKSFKTWSEDEFKADIWNNREYSGGQYETSLLSAFFNYWSEKTAQGKMKMQLEKSWETSKRLATWARNNETWNRGKASVPVQATRPANYGIDIHGESYDDDLFGGLK